MPARDEQLCDLNGTREDHEQDREPTTPSVVAQTKCKSSWPNKSQNARGHGVHWFQAADREAPPTER